MVNQGELFQDGDRRVPTSKRRRAVAWLLSDLDWHSTAEINSPAIGGSEGTRRLREIRAAGSIIEKRRRADSDQFEYRLWGGDPPRHQH